MSENTSLRGLRCVVLGGGGFLGTNLLKRLGVLEAECIAIGRPSPFSEETKNVDWRPLVDNDLAAHRVTLSEADVVFHLLGGISPSLSARDPAVSLDSSVRLTLELLRLRKGKIVFASSGGTVYGRTMEAVVSERSGTEPISFYGVEKLAVEKYLAADEWATGRPFVALRIANPYGPFQRPDRGQGVVAAILGRIHREQPIEIWGDGSTVRDFVFVEDVVEAMIASACYEGRVRVLNVGTGVGRSVLSVATDLRRLAGAEDHPIRFLAAQPADVPVNILDSTLAKDELGWCPRMDWETGLRKTIDWLSGRQLGSL